MMKTKYLLAALSLPMVFAACSNEFDELDSNFAANNKDGVKVVLNLQKDGDAESRAVWNGSGLGWADNDMISMYWTDSTQTNLPGNSNAIFKTTDGSSFTSESLVYTGANVVVFPANTKHYAAGPIKISVSDTQDATTVNKVPFISNLLDILEDENIPANTPGYHQDIYAPMKMAANVVTLKLDVKNTAALEKYGFNIESVDLIATGAFAKESHLIIDKNIESDSLENQGIYTYPDEDDDELTDTVKTIVASTWTTAKTSVDKLTSKAVVKDEDGTYNVTFVVLPTDVPAVSTAKIVVNTTCGTITLNSSDTNEDGDSINWVIKEAAKVADNDTVSIEDALAFFASSITMKKGTKNSKFDGEKVGRTITRKIAVDASKTTLNGSSVKTSADIIRYVNLYKDMQKKDAMNLVMVVDGAKATAKKAWAGLTKEAVAAIDAVNAVKETKNMITLTSVNVSEIQLSTVGSVYDVKAYNGDKLALTLTTGAWSMNDTLEVNDKFNKVINKGTLTIAGTATKAGQSTMRETIYNQGTINLGGNNKVWLNADSYNEPAGIVNVATGQELTFTEDTENQHGTINVAADAFLTVANGVKAYNQGVINNSGIIAAEGTNGLYNNACVGHLNEDGTISHTTGVINILNADAITYVQNNEGTIYMYNRSNEVVVKENTGKIVYNYDYATDGAEFEKRATDRFSYVVFGTDATAITLKNISGSTVLSFDDVSLEFKGSTTLTTNNKTIVDLVVANGANLKVNSENYLWTTNVTNAGTITIGGNIYYSGNYTNNGRILSVGTGAIEKHSPSTNN